MGIIKLIRREGRHNIMKKFLIFCVLISFIMLVFATSVCVYAEGFDNTKALGIYRNTKFADIKSASFAVYDCDNEQILTGKDPNKKLPVESLVKIMTVYIAYEYESLEKITFDELITTSSQAAHTPGPTAFISPGDKFSVRNALYAIIISSCNDVTIALAEHIAGSENEFVELMNLHASGLGMTNTKFVDCTGRSDENYTTANDLALLLETMVEKHPNYMEISKIKYDEETFRNGTGKFSLENTNKFLKFVPDSEGLKLGYSAGAKYCLATTYKDKDKDRRLIVVLLGAEDENTCYAETRRIFEYCVANYNYWEIQSDGEFVMDIKVTKGKEKIVGCEIKGEYNIVSTQQEMKDIERRTELPESLEAPLEEGDVVGKVIYTLNGEDIYELDIVLTGSVEKAGWFTIFIRWILEWFGFA